MAWGFPSDFRVILFRGNVRGLLLPFPPPDEGFVAESSETGSRSRPLSSASDSFFFFFALRRRRQMSAPMTKKMTTTAPTTPPAMAAVEVEEESDEAELVADAEDVAVEDGPPVGSQALAFAALFGRCAPVRLTCGQPVRPDARQAFSLQHPRKGGSVPVQV